jgi:hypothetical protein
LFLAARKDALQRDVHLHLDVGAPPGFSAAATKEPVKQAVAIQIKTKIRATPENLLEVDASKEILR